ncbi:Protein of unknown function [Pedococcus dokdonensis]|uniref:GmrSD restriction endonucleases C-terminal domain-containing protein n=1 Tax=Pedococcus dokdonensis TaxID=443156 RepID=A0A1H0KPK2_9MICO|nr:HNH endonuclease family protein [Pedococcus dokdonensis]SDO57894.1 Protein of unknown function [Pedococcus dokdonensis]
MSRRPVPHRPALAGVLLTVLAASGCGISALGAAPAATAPSTRATAPSTRAIAPSTRATAQVVPAAAPTATTGRTAANPTPAATTRHTAAKPTPAATRTVRPGSAVVTLATLTIKGRAPRTGYDRALFGQAWADVDRNGCDTRNDVLRRDLTHLTLKADTHGCLVLTGTLADPYTGRRIDFVRGRGTSNAVQVDHVVALSDAWQKGAQRWSTTTRTAFANDPLNLLAVDGPTNQRKGDGDAATWLPPRKAGRCAYVARQIAVKHRYTVSVTAAERDAMLRVLTTCPTQPLPH